MTREEVAERYDAVASWWLDQMHGSSRGVSALERAIAILGRTGDALDVGCGAEGRFFRTLRAKGFRCSGLDASGEMIRLARSRFPDVALKQIDVRDWVAEETFDLITAWDSVFHLPLADHELVIEKLCHALNPAGVLLFTCGGGNDSGSISGEFGGQRFSYSTLGVPQFVELLAILRCSVMHLEYDELPENHVCVIARRNF